MTAALLLCLVVGVTDGDTIKVRCDDEQIKIRLSEIDAPESKQPWGQRSKQSLSDLCFQKQAEVRPVTTDRYGRTVARVICDGVDANLEQVRAGMAWAYLKYLRDPDILVAEKSARADRAGLWSDVEPVPPWEWRMRLFEKREHADHRDDDNR
jgi:endonuclease YncB( thermonuclease family)